MNSYLHSLFYMPELTVTLTKDIYKCKYFNKNGIKHNFVASELTLHLKRILNDNDISLDIPLGNTVIDTKDCTLVVLNRDTKNGQVVEIRLTENEAIQIDCLLETYLESQLLFKKDEQ